MKLSPVLFFLPSALALPSFHSLENVDISISIREDNGLGTAVTKPTDFCMQKLFLSGDPCMGGWESVPIGDTDLNMCCLSKQNGYNDLMVVQESKAASRRLDDPLPPCTDKCTQCADVCDIVTHKCYNACVDSEFSRTTPKDL